MKALSKINIGFVMPPIEGHRARGTGTYYDNLLNYLMKDKRLSLREVRLGEPAFEFDLLHYPYFDPFFITMPLLGTVKKIPNIVTVHDMIPHKYPQYFRVGLRGLFKWSIQKTSLQRAKAIITDSGQSKTDIIKFTGIKSDKISVIPLAASEVYKRINDRDLLVAPLKKYKLPQNFILHVGDLNYNKNIDGLLSAFSRFIMEYTDFHLILIGKGFIAPSASLKLFLQKVKILNLEKKVIRLSGLELNDLVAVYNLSRMYVQPSFDEGFGLPVLEAFASGTPVISSKGGSLPEVAGNGALYFNPYNSDEILSAMKKVIMDYDLRKSLIEKGKIQLQKFSWEKTAEKTADLYFQVLNIRDYFYK